MPPSDSFWIELEQYLRSFHAGLSSLADGGDLPGASVWFRRGEGTLRFSVEEQETYLQLLDNACKQLAPDANLSRAAIDSALKEATFAVADIQGGRATDVEVRIRDAVDEFKGFIEGPGHEYECWIEVEGIEEASLPTQFATARFTLLGATDVDRLKDIVHEKHTAGKEGTFKALGRMEVKSKDDLSPSTT